ncbi:MAG: transcriptional repressor LexA [Defluviitaleaceae bacterium]|nr:transcriptional repressor LexA [Defluviitaleaceae bacterium]MCL2240810.1 transcriptional repressor LexA [Defluviitaleaceae bacterium]
MGKNLTTKQQMILDFLKMEIKQNGYPPTVREICDAVNLSSTSTVHAHLETLERKGYIRRSPAKNRSTEILEEDFYQSARELVNVPIVGRVAAGVPILADENIEDTFPIPIDYIKNDTCFMLHVKGDSMMDEGILDGDLVLVRQQQDANNGDIVIALLEDDATVKTFSREGDYVCLTPANDAFKPIKTKECSILGKVIGLYRRY